jgi:hypothetical protein
MCLLSRCLKAGCITRCSTVARRGRHRKHNPIYCCVLGRVYRAVAWQRVDVICYSIAMSCKSVHEIQLSIQKPSLIVCQFIIGLNILNTTEFEKEIPRDLIME